MKKFILVLMLSGCTMPTQTVCKEDLKTHSVIETGLSVFYVMNGYGVMPSETKVVDCGGAE
jgi:hypothetical protein